MNALLAIHYRGSIARGGPHRRPGLATSEYGLRSTLGSMFTDRKPYSMTSTHYWTVEADRNPVAKQQ